MIIVIRNGALAGHLSEVTKKELKNGDIIYSYGALFLIKQGLFFKKAILLEGYPLGYAGLAIRGKSIPYMGFRNSSR